jgi:hypothetical protein
MPADGPATLHFSFYDVPAAPADETETVARMRAICDEFEGYGYRRVGAALRHQGASSTARRSAG